MNGYAPEYVIMLIAIRISVDKAKKYVDFFIILFQTHFFETLPPQMSGGEKRLDGHVVGRITVDGSWTQFCCKLTVNSKLWNTKGRYVTGSTTALKTNYNCHAMLLKRRKMEFALLYTQITN